MSDNEQPGLTITRWLVIVVLFLIGVLFVSVAHEMPTQTLPAALMELAGSFIVIAIPVELIREFFFSDIERQKNLRDIGTLFDGKISDLLVNAKKYGLDRLVDEIDFRKLFSQLEKGDTLWWLDTFAPSHKQWLDSVQSALDKDATVKMLILQPGCHSMAYRGTEIGGFFTPEKFERDLRAFLEDFKYCAETRQPTARGHLEIKIYDDSLGCPIYLVEKQGKPAFAYSSMYLVKPTGVAFPHFKWVDAEAPVLDILYKYIGEKFARAKPLALAAYAENESVDG